MVVDEGGEKGELTCVEKEGSCVSYNGPNGPAKHSLLRARI